MAWNNIPAWLFKLLNQPADGADQADGFATNPAMDTSGSGGSLATTPPRYASAGLHINLSWDSSVTSSATGAAFMAAVQSAASMIEAAFATPITVNIAVGWGEYMGIKLASTTSAVGGGWSANYAYSTVKSALLASARSADDTSAYAALPASFTANANGTVAVYSGDAKALGLVSGTATGLDGFLGFGTSVPSGNWVGVALHELTHAFGRISGYAPYSVEDLFRFSAANTHIYAGPTPAYFSADNGATRIANFSTTSDYGDWANDALTLNDPFNAYYTPSTASSLTTADLRVLDVLGLTRAGATPGATLSIAATNASRLEGTTGSTPFTFTVTRGGLTSTAGTVAWSVAGTGAAPASAADFAGATLPSGTLSFAAGETSKLLSIAVAADSLVEADESFTVTLASPSTGLTITGATATGLILNNTASLAIAGTTAVQREGLSGTTPFTFTVTRSGYTGMASSARWAVAGSGPSAATAADFLGNVLPSGTITFAAGQTTQLITVNVLGGTAIEPDEGFTVTLSAPTAGTILTTSSATGLIQANGAQTGLSIAALSASKLEPLAGTTPFTFTVSRVGLTAGSTTVSYAVTGSGAAPASAADFAGNALPSGTLTFNPGQTSQTLTLNVAADGLIEPDEGFTVTLATPSSGAAIVSGSATGTILNANAALAIAATSASKTEGAPGTATPFTFTVTRTGYTGAATSAAWSVKGSGASPATAADFAGNVLPSGTVSFAAGETSKTVTINVAGDSLVEPEEGFTVALATPTNGVQLGTASASGTILAPPTPTGGLHINLVYDASVAAAPSGFRDAMQSAANLLQSAFSDAITVNIAVGWGEVGGTAITAHGVAEGGPTAGIWVPTATLKSALQSGARSAADSSAYTALSSAANPNGNGAIAVWSAQEKALGLLAPTATAIDGVIGFSTDFTASLWVGAALHEITHAMGRTSGYAPYGIADLFRFSAPGVNAYAGGTAAYASADGGRTILATYSPTSDYGDFATTALTAADPFNAYIPAGANSLTTVDLTMMDIIGFTRAATPGAATTPSFLAASTAAPASPGTGSAWPLPSLPFAAIPTASFSTPDRTLHGAALAAYDPWSIALLPDHQPGGLELMR